MAYRSLVDCFCYGNGYNVGQYLTTLGIKATSGVAQFTTLGTAWPTAALTGTKTAELSLAGPYEDTVVAPAFGTAGPDTTSRIFVAGFEGDTVSQRFYGFRSAAVGEVEIGLSPDDIDQFTPGIVVDGEFNYGYIVAPLAARTTAGNTQSTYADMGAAATGSAAQAFLVVTSISLGGYDSVTVTVQSSDDHVTFADETAFTTRSTIGAQSVTLADTTNRYLAIKWAYVGAGSSPTWTGFVGVSRD
jgi:hypothetical protein